MRVYAPSVLAAAIVVLIVALGLLGIGHMVSIALEDTFDRGFAAGQEYEEWFCNGEGK
jgi:hypothetical protein